MNLFSAAVAVTAIVGIVTLAKSWLESRKGSAVDQQRLDELENEFRGRIETLEQIVTDQREQLRRNIDEL